LGEAGVSRRGKNSPPQGGFFITLEGGEQTGKTTQHGLLLSRLRAAGYEPVGCREPGGTTLGERIRAILLAEHAGRISHRAEALLYAASRAQLVDEIIRPALDRCKVVVCDRFIDSSLAYQGYGLGLSQRDVWDLNLFAVGGLLPDLTLLLDGNHEDLAGRRHGPADRIEARDGGFHFRVRQGYQTLARRFPGRIYSLDASLSQDRLAETIWRIVDHKLRGPEEAE